MGILTNLLDAVLGGDDGDELTGWEHPPSLDCDCDDCAERWRVAVHECGHVAALEYFGEPWNSAEILPTGGGITRFPVDTDHLHHPDDIYRYMVIGHAGWEAEKAILGGEPGSSRGDNAVLDSLNDRLGDPTADDDAAAEAAKLVADNQGQIVDWAETLFLDSLVYP